MINSAPPPPLRDSKLELAELQRLARTFAFVKWLADEYAAAGRRSRDKAA